MGARVSPQSRPRNSSVPLQKILVLVRHGTPGKYRPSRVSDGKRTSETRLQSASSLPGH